MVNFTFDALGTTWTILIDQVVEEDEGSIGQLEQTRLELIKLTNNFELQFSRFIAQSQACQFRHAMAGTYSISSELTHILSRADVLKQLTDGLFDPAIGGLLEILGYDPAYQLKPDVQLLKNWQIPIWSLDESSNLLKIDGPVIFDIGGTGKGYWIDVLSEYLLKVGYPYHLVDGGGDMVATTKANGEGFVVALEWPGRPDMAIGEVALSNQGLAVSDTFRRRWHDWNHLVDWSRKQAVQQINGCMAIASTAWRADEMTSMLALSEASQYSSRVQFLSGEYLVIKSDNQILVSDNWPGQFF